MSLTGFQDLRNVHQQQYFISPHSYNKLIYNNYTITIVQQIIEVLAARNNLKVKNTRQPVKRKDVKMFRSGTQEQTNIEINRVK